MLLGGQTTEFDMNVILPIASYTNGVDFPIQFAYRPKATPFAGETGVIGNLASPVHGTPTQNILAISEPPSKIR